VQTGRLEFPPKNESNEEAEREEEDTVSCRRALPSWEGYFSAASELLYYSPQVKADYTPLLSQIFRTAATAEAFFEALYFGSVDEALNILNITRKKAPLTCLRSLLYQVGEATYRRPSDHGLVPVRHAPRHCFLKARGTDPPRTWTSALQPRLLQSAKNHPDTKKLVQEARTWYRRSVQYLLQDPKNADETGDYFAAYLRAAHRDVYDDVDRSDPEILRRREHVPSLSKGKKKKHRVGDISVPGVKETFDEWKRLDLEKKPSTAKDRVLSQIIVDAYQTSMVDVSAVLTVARCVAEAKSSKVVVVLYMGGEHTRAVLDFFQKVMGFGYAGLPKKGLCGKMEAWDDEERRALSYPDYLHDFELLFSLPIPSASKKKK